MPDNKAHCSSTLAHGSYCRDEFFVADFYDVSLGTVRRWRAEGRGPRYKKLGSLVRYSLEDLHGWLASRPTGGEGTGGGQ